MKTPGKNQNGKTTAAVRYIIYIIKIWNFYNQQVKYTQPGKLKTSTKSTRNPTARQCFSAQLYDLMYGFHMVADIDNTDPYGLYGSCTVPLLRVTLPL